jgi:hypothetical protein
MSARAQAETAWPALIAALHRAENAGHDAEVLLSSVASERELRTARSISEVLAWRIGHQLAATPDAAAREAAPSSEEVLPWLASPLLDADAGTGITRYLGDAADLINERVGDLASAAVRHRPPWMLPLGVTPQDPEAERQWLRHVAIVASYRDQFNITTDDPRQLLGPYPESGQPAHKPYWHAAESVLAARRLAGLDPTTAVANLEDQARAQLAADIYCTLPESERTAISTEMATRLGPLWFGDRTAPDEDAASQPAHVATLAHTLVRHGHLTTTDPSRTEFTADEPLEAGFARRGRAHRLRPAATPIPQPAPAQRRDPVPRVQVPNQAGPQHRL